MNKKKILSRIKDYYNLSTNRELADFLGVTPQTVSNWIARDNIDYDIIFTKCVDLNFDYLLTGSLPILKRVEDRPHKEDDTATSIIRKQINDLKTDLLQNTGDSTDILSEKLRPETTSSKLRIAPENYDQKLLVGTPECQFEYRKVLDGQNKEFKAERGDKQHGIPLIPITATAGPGAVVFDDLLIEQYYVIPELKNAEFMIRMKGSSMYPKYSSGDVLACTKVLNLTFFQWNKVYAIYTQSQGVMIKRVHEGKNEEWIKLISDNPKYPPFEVPKEEIISVALVIGCVRCE